MLFEGAPLDEFGSNLLTSDAGALCPADVHNLSWLDTYGSNDNLFQTGSLPDDEDFPTDDGLEDDDISVEVEW